jgi:hypothetical protein
MVRETGTTDIEVLQTKVEQFVFKYINMLLVKDRRFMSNIYI